MERYNIISISLISQRLGLSLVRWQGAYQEVNAVWLRWANLDGTILPTGEEKAQQAEQKAQKLAAKLKELGINPEDI